MNTLDLAALSYDGVIQYSPTNIKGNLLSGKIVKHDSYYFRLEGNVVRRYGIDGRLIDTYSSLDMFIELYTRGMSNYKIYNLRPNKSCLLIPPAELRNADTPPKPLRSVYDEVINDWLEVDVEFNTSEDINVLLKKGYAFRWIDQCVIKVNKTGKLFEFHKDLRANTRDFISTWSLDKRDWKVYKQKETIKKQGEIKMIESIKGYVAKHKELLITVAILIIVDKLVFKGAFTQKIKDLISGFVSKTEKALEKQE